METLALFVLPAVLVWGAISVRYSTAFTLSAIFLVAACVFPAEFQAIQIGGLTWTADRLVLLAVGANFICGWKLGKYRIGSWEAVDMLACVFLCWLTFRTLTQPLGSISPRQPHTLMHMINGYCVPFALYFAVRCSSINRSSLKPMFWILVALGGFLAITAILEVAKLWPLVFPRFVADPTLGIHFGRARGPMLQSVRLGTCLLSVISLVTVFSLWMNPQSRAHWTMAFAALPIFLVAIIATYTRSIWLGLIFVAAILVILGLQGALRRGLIVSGALAAIVLAVTLGPSLVAFKREYSAAETRESTLMRGAFAYVSWQMFKERPVAGFGFNQFCESTPEFLSDRSTDMRLESIRGYVHHNSYLSLLVDLGLVGFSLYFLMLVAFIRRTWRLWQHPHAEDWARGIALVTLCVSGVHLIQMAFHEVSYSSIENSILLIAFGLVISCLRQIEAEAQVGQAQPAAIGLQ
ncbi:MAG: O-antigen ligase family protein [Pirellulaceae bacterium]|nr:O-antigen ligase family protein [Pirellulaceae bacterium]